MITWVFVVACTEEPTPATATPSEPATDYVDRGPSEVGTAQVEVIGTGDLLLPVQLWYPTTDPPGAPLLYDGLILADATEDAAPDCAAAHPLVAFSHGSGGIRWQSAFLTEFLASHGYVVVAPDHVGNTFFDVGGDLDAIALRRPVDIEDVVDWLFAQAGDPASPYAGCVDPSAGYAIAGHSFGGTTTLALAGAVANDPYSGEQIDLADDRVWAALALAPWDGYGFLTDGVSEIGVPTMILTGALDEITPLEQVGALWDGLTVEPRYYGVFPEAGHFSFSPVACQVETSDGCGEGYIEPGLFTARVNTAATAFLEGSRGVDGALAQIPYDAAEIEWTTVP